MTELDVIIDAHRREKRRQDAITDVVCIGLAALLYAVVELIKWLV